MNTKVNNTDDQVVHYTPRHLIEGTAESTAMTSSGTGQYKYWGLDALYHFFEDDPAADASEETEVERGDGQPSHPEAIVKLLAGDFREDTPESARSCTLKNEPSFTHFRDNASFIGGAVTHGQLPQLRRWCYSYLNDAVYLDATGYSDEHGVGEEKSQFEQLMDLAGRTKEVIDDGICKRWPTDAKAVIRFINASQTDSIYSPDEIYKEGDLGETKWLIEGKFLAEELIKIPAFRQNFNQLVIFGAMRYILAGELNLNKLYRLMAKLGRINTRLYFIG